MNIYETITKVIGEVGAIGKEKRNQQQGFMYRGIDDVLNALQPMFAKYKLFIVPEILEQVREERQTAKGGTLIYSICKIKYTFYAEDGTHVEAVTIGEGMDSGDKATNKAMAIAMKYACFQVFCIPTEEMKDPDEETPPKTTPKEPKKGVLNEAQIKRMFAIAKAVGIATEQVKKDMITKFKKASTSELTKQEYDLLCNEYESLKK